MDDKFFLRKAAQIGNTQAPPLNFGAVIVKDGQILSEECNHVRDHNDPTAHAETSAIRAACQKLGTYNLDGCTMYGSHEPCLMCFSCAAWANIERVVYAIPASEATGFSYEFTGVTLQDLTEKLTKRKISVELIRTQ